MIEFGLGGSVLLTNLMKFYSQLQQPMNVYELKKILSSLVIILLDLNRLQWMKFIFSC